MSVTGFRGFHPLPCFLYYAGAAAFAMLLPHPAFLCVGMAAALALAVLCGGGAALKRWGLAYVLFALVSVLLNPLFSHRGRHVLFDLFDQPVTLEAVLYGAMRAGSVLAVLFVFLSYNRVMDAERFLHLFGRLAPKGALLTAMAMRFVPLMERRTRQIAAVQRTRGVDPLQGPLRKRMRDGMLLLQVLLAWSLEEGLQTADAMKSRGYGTGVRSAYGRYRMRTRDWVLLAALLLTAAGCTAGWAAGYGTWRIYPRLEPLVMTAGQWATLGCYVVFACIPIAIEGRDWWRWRFLR